MFEEWLKEATGDPDRMQRLLLLKQTWDQVVTQPGMAQNQAQMAQFQQQAQPAQPPQPMNPPTTEGLSLPDLGQGPGSVTGNQGGRPPGVM